MIAPEGHEDPALARKRRIEKLRATHRDGDANPSKRRRSEESIPEEEVTSSTEVDRNKPSIRGIKRQARYEPGVPMTREQLATWRKEARRVRNRESAAASRRKTRDRIDELETEVDDLKCKYEAALQRIVELENHRDDSGTPDILTQDLMERRQVVSPTTTPDQSPAVSPVSTPLSLSPTPSFSLEFPDDHQHIMDTISRPTAV